MGVGHQAHGILMAYKAGSQYDEMLLDDGTIMTLPAPLMQLELRVTAYYFVRDEYTTKIRRFKSTYVKFPPSCCLLHHAQRCGHGMQ